MLFPTKMLGLKPWSRLLTSLDIPRVVEPGREISFKVNFAASTFDGLRTSHVGGGLA